MEHGRTLATIPDDVLLRRLAELLRESRRVESDLVQHIAEVDLRRLYAREAAPSMFAYCTEVLHLSEAEAYLRIAVARASRQHPALLELLRDGRLHLTGIAKLAPLLTPENREELLTRAVYKSKREIEELIAEIAPRPDAPAVIRRLPDGPGLVSRSDRSLDPGQRQEPLDQDESLEPFDEGEPQKAFDEGEAQKPHGLAGSTGEPSLGRLAGRSGTASHVLRPDGVGPSSYEAVAPTATAEPGVVEPLRPGRYKVQFTASGELREKLERLRALLRPEIPDGDLAGVIERAVTEKLERIEARRHAASKRPRKGLAPTAGTPRSRHVPAAVRRVVRERNGDQCGFVEAGGRRCSERHRLEYHHRHPFGMGGDHETSNIGLVCHTHNNWLAEHDYGQWAIASHRGVDLIARNSRCPW